MPNSATSLSNGFVAITLVSEFFFSFFHLKVLKAMCLTPYRTFGEKQTAQENQAAGIEATEAGETFHLNVCSSIRFPPLGQPESQAGQLDPKASEPGPRGNQPGPEAS